MLMRCILNQVITPGSLANRQRVKVPAILQHMLRCLCTGFQIVNVPHNQEKKSLDISVYEEVRQAFLSDDQNIVALIVEGDFIGKTCLDELAEPALTLLSKIALAYPDSMTKAWLANYQFQSNLRDLV
jgi:hypothetical protein